MTNEMLAGIVGGAVGALIGSLTAWYASHRANIWARAFDMHREFNSEPFASTRNLAFRCVKRHPGASFSELDGKLGHEEAKHIWEVVYFYQRLSLAIRHNQIATKGVPELFGPIFTQWYVVALQMGLKDSGWAAADEIEHVNHWLQSHTRPEIRERWASKGRAILEESLRAR